MVFFRRQRQRERWGAHQEAHERLHGLVQDETAPDSAGEPKNAQLRDLKTAGLRVEAVDGEREAAVHRRGEADPRQAYDRPSGLQVSAETEAKEFEGARVSVCHAVSFGLHGGFACRSV